jgi:XTP/dITP diphosphohydrolase
MKIVLATRNPDKIREIKQILKDELVSIDSLLDYVHLPEIIEDGLTLEENARKKARLVHEWTRLPAVADDTGLEVEVLGGSPGIYSSRYAGENATYEDNVKKLLHQMEPFPLELRKARFRTVVFWVNSKQEIMAQGVLNGYITNIARGKLGFGYDPIFMIENKMKTLAELTLQEKNKISHRGKAFKQLRRILIQRKIIPLN